ncbi:hydrogenase maturation factor [Lachnospiraceae bacterium]|nr:hydrogenase maturation factor [Lachnospiraceae bacterium]
MRTGKLPENVWKRSVQKQMKTKRKEIFTGAGIGEDCAVLSFGDDSQTVIGVHTGHWPGKDMAKLTVHRSVNALAAAGAHPAAMEVSVLFPVGTEEGDVKSMAAQIEGEGAFLGIQTAGCGIEISGAVNCPVITVTGIGNRARGCMASVKNVKPGMDVVASKWIGLEGTVFLVENQEKELLARYPARFLGEAQRLERFLSVIPEAAVAGKSGVCAMHSVGEGGIFGALWELAEGAGVGLDIDLKKIPVKQETIEICEFFGLNPYELASGGCLLMVSGNGHDLVREMEKQQIQAAVIGKITDSNDRVVINGEERRFLENPKADEIYKVL